MRKNLRFILLTLVLSVIAYAGCTYEYSLDPYHDKVNPNGAKVDTTGVTEYEGISISNSFLPVNFDGEERKVLEADTASGHFTMKADDQTLKQLGVGSIVAFDTDSLIFLRKVKQVHIENGVAKMETEEANPFEVIRGGRFGIDIDGKNPIMTRSSAGSSDGSEYPVFHPVEMRYKDKEGHWHREKKDISTRGGDDSEDQLEPGDIVGTGSDHKGTVAYDHTVFSKTLPFTTLPAKDGSKAVETEVDIKYYHGSREESDFHFLFELNLFEPSFIKVYKEFDSWDTTRMSIDIKGGAKHEVFTELTEKPKTVYKLYKPIYLTTAVIPIAGFPFVIDIFFNPELSITLGTNAFASIEWETIQIKKGMKSGLEFRTDNGLHRIDDKGTTEKDVTQITKAVGGGTTQFKASFAPQFELMFYGLAGPYLGVEGYIESSFSIGAGYVGPTGDKLVAPADKTDYLTCAYQFKTDVGLNLIGGIEVDCLNQLFPGFNDDVKMQKINYPLIGPLKALEAPSSLKCNTRGYNINVGKKNELEFQVLAKTLLWNPPFVLPYYIFFETTGDELLYYEKDEETGFSMPVMTDRIADFSGWGDGKYSVTWTPASINSKLLAYILGPKGDQISSVVVKASNTGEDCTPVDMGTSCLWAPMNVGAKVATDRGDYVGWGDATGKHKEQGAYSSADGTTEADDEVLKSYYGGKKAPSNIAGGAYDYATAKWGGDWRLPTKNEWQELIDNCTWEWNVENKAYLITSKETGNQLILPANGYRLGTEYADGGHHCNYWSSNLYTGTKDRMEAYYFSGRPNRAEKRQLNANYHTPRYFGQGVRPVMDKPNEYDFSDLDY